MRRRAFTLIELLFVVAIIFMLASLTFPAFLSAREKARATSCLSNVRSIGVAITLYKSDYDDSYPPAVDGTYKFRSASEIQPDLPPRIKNAPLIQDILMPYTRSSAVFRCPDDWGLRNMTIPRTAFEAFGSSYRVWALLCGETDALWDEPSRLVYLEDASGEWHTEAYASYWDLKLNALFLDGHAKFVNIDRRGIAPFLSYWDCRPIED